MMVRIDMWHREREEAATLHPNGVRTLALDHGERSFEALVWNPAAKKPTTRRGFSKRESRDAFLVECVANFTEWKERKARERTERKAKEDAADLSVVDPGAIFSYSWGYEQTQVEFWQVVERKGRMLTLRRIHSHSVDQTSWASDRVEPAKDAFIDPPCAVPDCGMGKEWRGHGSSGAFEHAYVAGPYPDVVKRVGLDYAGNPSLTFEFGGGSLWKPGETRHRSWYG